MINGRVVAGEMIVPLEITSLVGSLRLDAVIDTGFTDFLTLTHQHVRQLGLALLFSVPAMLADGSTISVDLYIGTVVWDGQPQTVRIHCTEGGPLLGMEMLTGYRLSADVTEGGCVLITQL